jgi:hypothetical protein
MESLGKKIPMKKPHKEKAKAQNKEKILDNIVLEKEDKGFDSKECCLVAKTIGEKYNVCFLFGITPMPNVEIEVHIFK